jgi:hypothetical protein
MKKKPCGCCYDDDMNQLYRCYKCQQKEHEQIRRNMSSKELIYDMEVPYQSGCSCHISAPCSYCVDYDDTEAPNED